MGDAPRENFASPTLRPRPHIKRFFTIVQNDCVNTKRFFTCVQNDAKKNDQNDEAEKSAQKMALRKKILK